MPGHNGLFARQFPIAFSYFEYVDITGFSRRRFDLFAIMQFAQAIVLEDLLRFPVLANREVRIIICLIAQHRPGHTCSLIGQGNSSHVGMAPRGDAGNPTTEPVISVFGL